MKSDELLLVSANEVEALLHGEEIALMDLVGAAYATHGRGETVVPHSCFLRFPAGRERIIALPAYLGGGFRLAGMKWIASFPGNVARGGERASGVVVLNCPDTGRPRAVVDGGIVSAKRTAASAAVAARALHVGDGGPPRSIGFVGCGAINFETLRFLRVVWPGLARILVTDLSRPRAETFVARACVAFSGLEAATVDSWHDVMTSVPLVSLATTAMAPYVDELPSGSLRTVLHLSLRDLAPAVVLAADNVVDDADHVCRADTSLERTERMSGGRAFIRCTLADVLAGCAAPKRGARTTIFSPFGLGILDIAVANFVCGRAEARGVGTRIPWATRAA